MYVYTDTPWLMYSYILEDPVQVKFSSSQNSVHKWSALGMYPWESSWNPDSSTLQPDWPQHAQPAACIITHLYSSETYD